MIHDQNQSEYFQHERLDAYRHALEAVQLVADRRGRLRGLPGNAGPQLERAVVGAITNLCSAVVGEGAERQRCLRIALAEASESGAASDVALVFGGLSEGEHARLRQTLLRLCSCLRGLLRTPR